MLVNDAVGERRDTHVVEDGERGDDGVGEVNARQATRLVAGREERHQGTANNTAATVSDWIQSGWRQGVISRTQG